jgi:hypothetical protein
MRVISKKPISEFWERHPESRPALDEWFRKAGQLAAESLSRAAAIIPLRRLSGWIHSVRCGWQQVANRYCHSL